MRLSQVVLLLLMVAFGGYVSRLRTAFRDRVIFIVLAAVGGGLVLAPESTNRVAHALGIGRGADLVIYLFIVFTLFVMATLVTRIRGLEGTLTRLVQDRAIERPITGDARAAGGSPAAPAGPGESRAP